jgi:CheY-like chemotaxis protein
LWFQANCHTLQSLIMNQPVPSPTILIVDDNAMVRSWLSELLEKYNLLKAGSGEDALEQLIRNPGVKLDLLISDFQLPGWTGYETLQRIRKIFPRTKSILISGTHKDQLDKYTGNQGFDRSMPKPLSNTDLETTVEELLSKKDDFVDTKPLNNNSSTQQIQLPKELLFRLPPNSHS